MQNNLGARPKCTLIRHPKLVLDRKGITSVSRDDSGANFMEAVKEHLGVGFKKQDGPVSIFVVDNIEYPTAN